MLGDLLGLILDCSWVLVGNSLDLEHFWRLSLCFFCAVILAGVVELASSQDRSLSAVSTVVLGTIAGIYWEWRARRRGP
jgi:hypothetical protein